MLSILKFSGKHWSRAALGWALFILTVDGLAQAGAESAESILAAHNAAVALGVLAAAERGPSPGALQVARIAVRDLDLKSLSPAAFGDRDESDHVR